MKLLIRVLFLFVPEPVMNEHRRTILLTIGIHLFVVGFPVLSLAGLVVWVR